ncbi:serine hydrolase domain-containing protein [Planctobacterium marinum]|uniref:Penicillin-binding protein 4 n=1 Tax=Planctobacterium marinum TaxID=1631968 RepID=A0AA48HD50_9ALTE|nr:penicillin-binding protein 4* [Planctobacterium marinum]
MKKKLVFSLCLGMFGVSATAQAQDFEKIMQCHYSADAPGMAVRLEQSGQLIYSNALGLANIDEKRPLREDSVFQIGSATKTFTAAAILKLAKQKKLSLQDPLGKFIPTLNSEYSKLTIARVLSHTAGLPDYLDNPEVTAIWDKYATIDQVLNIVTKQALIAEMGQRYSYSNMGYLLLGKVIEVASGLPFSQFMQNSFFKPLKMNSTFVITKGTTAGSTNGYTLSQDGPEQYIKPDDPSESLWNIDRSWIYAAGAIASTLADMSLWNKALKSGKVISKDSYQMMTTKATLEDGTAVNYGFGIDIYPISGMESFSHQGRVPGFFAWNITFPQQELSATIFSNQDTQHPGPALLDMISVQLGLSPQPVTETSDIEALASKLVGKYETADSEVLTITFENKQLYAQFEGQTKRMLIPRENDAYSYECTENYFQLRVNQENSEIVPVDLYRGAQPALVKL